MPLPEVVPCLLVWFRQMASGQQQCEVPAMTRRKPWIFNDFNGTDGIYQDTYRHFNNLQVLFLTWSRQGLRITCSVQWNNEKQKYTAVEEHQVLRDVRSVTTVEAASFHIPKKSPCCCWPGCRSLMLRKGRAKVARQAGCDPESLRVRPANCSLYLLVTSSESTPNLCHFHVPCDRMHSILILACSCFVATWDLFCLGDTSDNCFVSGLPCLIFSWNWRLFLFLLFAQSLKVLGSDKRMGEKIPSSCLVSILTLMNNPRRNIVVGLAFLVLHVPVHTTCPTSSTLFADLEPQHTFTTY